MSESKNALEIQDLKKSFGGHKVLKGISFEVKVGEILGLFGGSGSGKSVVLRSIIGLEKADSGHILFQGQDISVLSERQLGPVRTQIAYVFQNGALFDSLTVEQNLSYPLQEHTHLKPVEILDKVNHMLKLIDMEGAGHLFPNELSGGMQKRAGLARAIILEPKIILFDEPTAGLDPVNTKRLTDNIKKLKATGITGVFVTHDIPSAFEIADRIAILYQGRIHIVDTIENIKKSKDPLVQSFVSGALGNTSKKSERSK